jgi:hypothetical protein
LEDVYRWENCIYIVPAWGRFFHTVYCINFTLV